MELQLRPYQESAIDGLRKGFQEGHRAQILYLPTGGGKTECAISMLHHASAKGNPTAFVMDRRILVDQTSARVGKYGIEHGVLMAKHPLWRPEKKIQVCSIQTLEAKGSFPACKLLVIDECFTGDTLISTPSGDKPIKFVRCGDLVYNSTGVGTVKQAMVRPTNELYRLEYEDGRIIECTANHPILTDSGWIKSSEMEVGRVSFSEQGLSLLWEVIHSKNKDGIWKDSSVEQSKELGKALCLFSVMLQEIEKSDEQSSKPLENESETERNKSQANTERWEREIASIASACLASCVRGGMGSRVSYRNKVEASWDWLSNLLQDGLSEPSAYDWNRSRRFFSLLNSEERTRFEKERISCFPRLVNISRIQRESVTPVFNLHISGHPSYFANGRLVHNCHMGRKSVTEFIENYPEVKVVGLSASPFTTGLGKIYTNVVNGATTKQLVDEGMLSPMRVFIAKEIDMKGANKVGGEWSDRAATERGIRITGDIINEWEKKTMELFGKPEKTIVFCAGVAHGADLASKFYERGYNFVSISYKDDDEYKKEAIAEFAKPESTIHGLIATDILTKGFDAADIQIGISARPFSKSFSSHVQQMGRVMRPHHSKDAAIWLDFSGNYLRFREQWDEVYQSGVNELSCKDKTAKEKTDKEKEAMKCPKCGQLWGKTDTCPHCGFVKVRQNKVEVANGVIEELDEEKTTGYTREYKEEFYQMLVGYARNKGYSDGFAFHKYKDKFGIQPAWKKKEKMPTFEVIQFIRDSQEKFKMGFKL